jgi:hypothetical protein
MFAWHAVARAVLTSLSRARERYQLQGRHSSRRAGPGDRFGRQATHTSDQIHSDRKPNQIGNEILTANGWTDDARDDHRLDNQYCDRNQEQVLDPRCPGRQHAMANARRAKVGIHNISTTRDVRMSFTTLKCPI